MNSHLVRSKYHARKTTVDGITFHSAKEAKRYGELTLLEKAGEIHHLTVQPGFDLRAFKPGASPVWLGQYIADFAYCTCRRTPCERCLVVEDVKGMATLPLAKWKQRHFTAQYGIPVREIR